MKVGRQQVVSDEFVVRALKRVMRGDSPSEVSNDMDVSVTTVCAWCRKAGVAYVPKRFKRDWSKIRAEL